MGMTKRKIPVRRKPQIYRKFSESFRVSYPRSQHRLWFTNEGVKESFESAWIKGWWSFIKTPKQQIYHWKPVFSSKRSQIFSSFPTMLVRGLWFRGALPPNYLLPSSVSCEFFTVFKILIVVLKLDTFWGFLQEVNMLKPRVKNKHLTEIGLFSMCSFGVLTSDMMNGDGTIFCFKLIESFGMISQQTSWLTPDWTWTSGVKKYFLAMIYWTNAFSSKVNLVSNLFPMSVFLKCWPTPSREHS